MLADAVLAHEQMVRLSAFFIVLVGLASWEVLSPRRELTVPKARRWKSNLALLLLNSLMVRALFPAAAVGFAAFAEAQSSGLLHIRPLPVALAMVVAVIVLDLAIYLQHILFHALPILWRLHRVHHADLDFDVTTGTRFHPVEILLSMAIKFLVIMVLGPPLLAVLIFETLLNISAMFNHSNIRLPEALDGVLRKFVVTPDMHRVHHSVERAERDSNFGFCFSLWDRLFGTYQAKPRLGHAAMRIGVAEVRDPGQVVDLMGLLRLPFKRMPSSNATSQSIRCL